LSRIGKKPIEIPAGVDVSLDGVILNFKKGKNSHSLDTKGNVNIEITDGKIIFTPTGDNREAKAFWGTYRALSNNVISGLITDFEKKLEINGVGYRASVKGQTLELQLGFSHPINYDIPAGITISVEKNVISVKGSDKQQVGQVSAEIRSFRPPEPYKGKGVKYADEKIIRKAGKTAKK
jgi:large subunit ribosomal protein L6